MPNVLRNVLISVVVIIVSTILVTVVKVPKDLAGKTPEAKGFTSIANADLSIRKFTQSPGNKTR